MTQQNRKYRLAFFSLGLLTLMTLGSVVSTVLAGLLSTFITGMVSILGLYYTGNVATKYVVGKNGQLITIEKDHTTATEKQDEEG